MRNESAMIPIDFADKSHSIIEHCDGGYVIHPFCTRDKDLHIRIHHLHQLQNLIFALTGQELTINP